MRENRRTTMFSTFNRKERKEDDKNYWKLALIEEISMNLVNLENLIL